MKSVSGHSLPACIAEWTARVPRRNDTARSPRSLYTQAQLVLFVKVHNDHTMSEKKEVPRLVARRNELANPMHFVQLCNVTSVTSADRRTSFTRFRNKKKGARLSRDSTLFTIFFPVFYFIFAESSLLDQWQRFLHVKCLGLCVRRSIST